MSLINFDFGNVITTIQCNEDDIFKDICIKFGIKVQKNINDVYFVYNGKIINELEKKFNEIADTADKEKKEMNISVIELNENKDKNTIIKSKEIICPICRNGIKIEIKIKEYKIKLYECKNNHVKILTFDEFEKTQFIDESKIICDNCREKNKSNTY